MLGSGKLLLKDVPFPAPLIFQTDQLLVGSIVILCELLQPGQLHHGLLGGIDRLYQSHGVWLITIVLIRDGFAFHQNRLELLQIQAVTGVIVSDVVSLSPFLQPSGGGREIGVAQLHS